MDMMLLMMKYVHLLNQIRLMTILRFSLQQYFLKSYRNPIMTLTFYESLFGMITGKFGVIFPMVINLRPRLSILAFHRLYFMRVEKTMLK